ncbi:MAG: nucleoside phosphorylase [Bacteroidota bacterium]|nr:nucleoside phosphorylase [Bacteroidota bacterium]
MTQEIKASELTLANDGSLYHIRLFPEELADNIILVGDPNRVASISKFFSKIEVKKANREIVSHTGWFDNKRVTAISTGMGVDNIDIVLTELDACKNIDLKSREIKEKKTSLNLLRLGTTGAMQEDMEINSCICSKYVLGIDGMMWFYALSHEVMEEELQHNFIQFMDWNALLPVPYGVEASEELLEKIAFDLPKGITVTAPGFYGPQGRELRMPLRDRDINTKLPNFSYNNYKITNYEMETSALYCLGRSLGHKTLTICNVIANRYKGTFSTDYAKSMNNLIETVLQRL